MGKERISLNDVPIDLFYKYFNQRNYDTYSENKMKYEDLSIENNKILKVYNNKFGIISTNHEDIKEPTLSVNGEIYSNDSNILISADRGSEEFISSSNGVNIYKFPIITNVKLPVDIRDFTENSIEVEHNTINVSLTTDEPIVYNIEISREKNDDGEYPFNSYISYLSEISINNNYKDFIGDDTGTSGEKIITAIKENKYINTTSVDDDGVINGKIISSTNIFTSSNPTYVICELTDESINYKIINTLDRYKIPMTTIDGRNYYEGPSGETTLESGYVNSFYTHQNAIRKVFNDISKENGWQYLPGLRNGKNPSGKVALVQQGKNLRFALSYDVIKNVTYEVSTLPSGVIPKEEELSKLLVDNVKNSDSGVSFIETTKEPKFLKSIYDYDNVYKLVSHDTTPRGIISDCHSPFNLILTMSPNIDFSSDYFRRTVIINYLTYTTVINNIKHDVDLDDNSVCVKYNDKYKYFVIQNPSSYSPYIIVPLDSDTETINIAGDIEDKRISNKNNNKDDVIVFKSGLNVSLRAANNSGVDIEILKEIFSCEEDALSNKYLILYPVERTIKEIKYRTLATIKKDTMHPDTEYLKVLASPYAIDKNKLMDIGISKIAREIVTSGKNLPVVDNYNKSSLQFVSDDGSFVKNGLVGSRDIYGGSIQYNNTARYNTRRPVGGLPIAQHGDVLAMLESARDRGVIYYNPNKFIIDTAIDLSTDILISFKNDEVSYIKDPYSYTEDIYIKKTESYSIKTSSESEIEPRIENSFKIYQGNLNRKLNKRILFIDNLENEDLIVKKHNIENYFRDNKTFYIDGSAELRGPLIDDNTFYTKRKEHLGESLKSIIDDNFSSYIDLKKLVSENNQSMINTYNFAKGISHIISAYNTSLSDNLSDFKSDINIEDVNPYIILSKTDFSYKYNNVDTNNAKMAFYTNRSILEKLSTSKEFPIESEYTKYITSEHASASSKIRENLLRKTNVNLGYSERPKDYKNVYNPSGDIYREILSNSLIDFLFDGKAQDLYPIKNVLENIVDNSFPYSNDSSTTEKILYSKYDLTDDDKLQELVGYLLSPNNGTIMEVL